MKFLRLPEPVVVLGGGGFIGANLVHRLRADGYEVQAVDIEFPAWRGVSGAKLDLRDPTQANLAVAGAGTVFHLAADMGGVGYFHSGADLGAAMANGIMSHNVIEACATARVRRLFYASSACAYPTECQMEEGLAPLLSEDMLGFGTPDALYGAEKLHTLRLMGKVPHARVGVFHTIYGPLQEHEGVRMKFPAAVATKALAARESGILELWGDGSQLRSYCYIDDAVEQIIRVASANDYRGPVNIGAQGAISCRAVAEMCLDLAGAHDAEIRLNPNRPSGVLARDCSLAKFSTMYGATQAHTYPHGFAKFLDWLDAL